MIIGMDYSIRCARGVELPERILLMHRRMSNADMAIYAVLDL
jgi:hypothetical protein